MITLQVALTHFAGADRSDEKQMQEAANQVPVRGGATLWTIYEAASFLRISTGTLYHWVSQKRIPCMHFGSRCLRFDPQQVRQWAAAFGETDSGHK
jgi:excisionase family DNA binding protein